MNFLLLFHALITLALIGIILVQRSEGGGLVSGQSGGPGSMFSARGATNFMSRLTAILATFFMANSLLIAIVASRQTHKTLDIVLDTKDSPTVKASLENKTQENENVSKDIKDTNNVAQKNQDSSKKQ